MPNPIWETKTSVNRNPADRLIILQYESAHSTPVSNTVLPTNDVDEDL
jgi:hypothetical protein